MTENEIKVDEQKSEEQIQQQQPTIKKPKNDKTWRMDVNQQPSNDLLKEGNEWKFGSKGWRQSKILSEEQKEQQKQKMKEIRIKSIPVQKENREKKKAEVVQEKLKQQQEKIEALNQINDTKELIKEMRKYTQLMEASTRQVPEQKVIPETSQIESKSENIIQELNNIGETEAARQVKKVEIKQQIQQQKQIISNNPIFKKFGIQQ